MFGIYDPIFDLDRDGKLNAAETALFFEVLDEMEKENSDDDDFDDDSDGSDW